MTRTESEEQIFKNNCIQKAQIKEFHVTIRKYFPKMSTEFTYTETQLNSPAATRPRWRSPEWMGNTLEKEVRK